METIKIRTFGETVYFLNSKGFQKGTIKSTTVASNQWHPLSISYRVTCSDYNKEYQGDEKIESQLFDSKEEMIKHYAKI